MTLDCIKCIGVCCITPGSVVVTDDDIERLSRHLGVSNDEFETVRVTVENENKIIKSGFEPCPFLKKGQCSVYEARPEVCRQYLCWEAQDLTYGIALQLANANVTQGRLDVKQNKDELSVILQPDP